MIYSIPKYGIKIRVINTGASLLESNLLDFLNEDEDECLDDSITDVLESLILAQAAAGIDIESRQYLEALDSAMDAINLHIL